MKTRFPISFASIVLVVALMAPARAQAPELSSPKSAARSIYDAVSRNDEAALSELLHADGAPQRDLADAYAHFVIQGKRLADAAKLKYPGASDAISQSVISAEDVAKLDQAMVVEKGDVATLRFEGKAGEMKFRRTENGWRLIVMEPGLAAGEDSKDQASLVREFAKAMSDTADEIAADKHPTPQDAKTALQTKVNVVLTKAVRTSPPASAPVVPPTTVPSR